MKVKISVAIFILQISFINCTIMEEIQNGITECCKAAYSSNADSQNTCAQQLKTQYSGSLAESYLLYNLFKKVTLQGERAALTNIMNEPTNKAEYDSKDEEGKTQMIKRVYDERITEIENEGKTSRTNQINRFTNYLKTNCEVLIDDFEKAGAKNILSIDLLTLVMACGTAQFHTDDWIEFIKFLKDNDDVLQKLKNVHATAWQMMHYLDNKVIEYLKSSNDKDTLFSQEFIKFLEWLFKNKKLDDKFILCDLNSTLNLYNQNKAIINEDLEKNKNTIVNELAKCAEDPK